MSLRHVFGLLLSAVVCLPGNSLANDTGIENQAIVLQGRDLHVLGIGQTALRVSTFLERTTSGYLQLPSQCKVIKAILFWAGAIYPNLEPDPYVIFTNPAGVTSDVRARKMHCVREEKQTYYLQSADVTEFLSGSGLYEISEIEADKVAMCQNNEQYLLAAWNLVVVVEELDGPNIRTKVKVKECFDTQKKMQVTLSTESAASFSRIQVFGIAAPTATLPQPLWERDTPLSEMKTNWKASEQLYKSVPNQLSCLAIGEGPAYAVVTEVYRDVNLEDELYCQLKQLQPTNISAASTLESLYQNTPLQQSEVLVIAKAWDILQDEERAILFWQQALQSGPTLTEAYQGLVRIYTQRQDWGRVIGVLEQQHYQEPAAVDVTLALANAYQQQGQWEKAKQINHDVLQRDSHNWQVQVNLFNLSLFSNTPEQAKNHFIRLLESDYKSEIAKEQLFPEPWQQQLDEALEY